LLGSQTDPPHRVTLDDIGTSVSDVENKRGPDPEDILETHHLEAARLENELARSKIKDVEADREMRKSYAAKILGYLFVYSVVVLILIVGSGFNFLGFNLPLEVQVSLVGRTAVAAIGLVGFIARGLF
jgi:hypothetical protein